MIDGPAGDDSLAPLGRGEIVAVTMFFADLVDSTALSARMEPETYRMVVGRYREQVLHAVERHQGRIGSTKGDGLLAVFGHPISRSDDAHRAIRAGLEIVREVSRLSEQVERRWGFRVEVRVGVHSGPAYLAADLDGAQPDFAGSTANQATRISGLASPGAVVITPELLATVGDDFDLQAQSSPQAGDPEEKVIYLRVLSERLPSR
ncbi:adenylate/guanylate cyclase domain-containing protein [Mycolicibacterium chubuense]|uniref:Adenylate cyclase 1 n=1 Tax=Mycolicibacterium chubuense TaxID=1800 RepID=A0A0J6W913_MYCCU|nr:adenylate/guanylate cyclase domain-containing protein [Mycolicibacterium chubuense]KMO79690.1 Adenylate cyclase 1 [Mycolicibacterium chubuense]ORA51395.1 adenylate/guanylate cyclase domain-containing protein [Mycolicibacterium chubuense]SPX98201.1 adenylate/guanylate cyclase [Mycolicibacterium chubuense]